MLEVAAAEFYGGKPLNLTAEVLQLVEAGEVQMIDLTPLKETITNLNSRAVINQRNSWSTKTPKFRPKIDQSGGSRLAALTVFPLTRICQFKSP